MKKTLMLLAGVLMLAGSASAQETAEQLFKSGKEAFAAFDKDLGVMQMTPDKVDKNLMAENLLKGFADLEKELPLDSVKQLNKDGSLKKIFKGYRATAHQSHQRFAYRGRQLLSRRKACRSFCSIRQILPND